MVCLLIRPENVRQAMTLLERQFGKPQYLVASQIQRVRDIAPIEEGRLDQFVPFAAKVATMVAYLDTPRARQHLFNPMILEELLLKLPQRERREWGRHARDMQPYPSLKEMSAWLDTVAEEMSESTVQYPAANARQRKPASQPKTSQFTMLADSTPVASVPRVCGMCNRKNHFTTECYWLTHLDSDARWKAVKERQLCGACLGGHHFYKCESKKPCGIDGCTKQHHPILHHPAATQQKRPGPTRSHRNPFSRPSRPALNNGTASSQQGVSASSHHNNAPTQPNNTASNQSSAPAQTNDAASNQTSATTATTASSTSTTFNGHVNAVEPKVLFRIVPVKLFGPSRVVNAHALLDEGSSVSLIDEDLSDELGLDGPRQQLHLNWFGPKSTAMDTRKVQLSISGVQHNSATYALQNVHTVRQLKLPSQTVHIADLRVRHQTLRQVPFADQDCVQPKLLIKIQ